MPEFEVVVTQHVRHYVTIEADTPKGAEEVIGSGDWSDKNNEVVHDRVQVFLPGSDDCLLDTDAPDPEWEHFDGKPCELGPSNPDSTRSPAYCNHDERLRSRAAFAEPQPTSLHQCTATDATLDTLEWCLQFVVDYNGDDENVAEAAAVLGVVKGWRS